MNVAVAAAPAAVPTLATGVDGLDDILGGGYAPTHVHLIEGDPGTGKTTLALQFLRDGATRGERCLYITLSETRAELLAAAASHNWSLDGIDIYELVPPELSLDPAQEQSIVYAADLELGETVRMVMAELERIRPVRVVFDSLADIRQLAQSGLRYRRQVMALKYYLARHGATALLLDDLTEHSDNLTLHSIAHGVLRLEQVAPAFGAERRRLRVYKMRGRAFRGGFHDFVIRQGGIVLFPRLIAAQHREQHFAGAPLLSGVAELDRLVGGGLDRGTATLLLGPSGAGKSSLALKFVTSALAQGEKVLMITFDEVRHVLLRRAAGMGMDLAPHVDSGLLALEQIDPAEFPPGEVVSLVRRQVEHAGTGVVVLDSLNGYRNAMLDESFLVLQIHELLSYLNQRGVVTLMVLAQHGLVGPMQTPVDLTYVSDSVLLLRFFEAAGQIRRAISVMKRRTGGHELTIREYLIDAQGIRVGGPLHDFRGVLTGVPNYVGPPTSLLSARTDG
ncbi:MAG TPA: ATPase domain-containing protein [Acetobacteraceae bacterium]|nr:ATPase domain-containing protein [Acetobacteraceae bacterium]